jgi:Ser/Thr protein kinase RdoA (MazF antagonist)
MDPTSSFMAGAIKVATPFFPVVYSTPRADAVADFVLAHYDLPGAIECKLLHRGFNDTFEVRTSGGERFIFRVSARRARGDADVASETAFLAYLDGRGIPVAAAVPMRDGSLFTSAFFPDGQRPAVLFRHAEGRPSKARGSFADARANGVTLARLHDVAGGFAADDKARIGSTATICCTNPYLSYWRSKVSAIPCAQGWLI